MADNLETKSSSMRTRQMSKSSEDNIEPSLLSIDKKLNAIISALETTNSDIKDIRKEQGELAASVEFCHSHIRELVGSMKEQDVKINSCVSEVECLRNENGQLTRRVNGLEQQINECEQYSHRNNLIVYGVPQDSKENILHVIMRLAKAIRFEGWSDKLVDAAHRMGQREKEKDDKVKEDKEDKEDYVKPIIIKFVSRLDRDIFLQKRKVKRNLLASDLGFASENIVYVNESLTPANRKLLLKTREVAKKKGYEYIWTFNCSIFVRKSTGAPAKKILREGDLETL